MTINEKLTYFAKNQGYSKYKFCKKTGLTQGSLSGARSVGVEALAKIVDNFPELNLEWLMFDREDIIVAIQYKLGQ